jgi:hypothetical protein
MKVMKLMRSTITMQTRKYLQAAAVVAAVAAALWPCQVKADTSITVVVNGTPITFNGPPPIEQDGTVLVPLRGVFEALGAGVVYDSDTRTISARKGRHFVTLPLGSNEATVNGQQQQLSVPATVTDGSTFIPLRFVAEALGAYVEWQAADSTVDITTSEQPVAEMPAPAPVPIPAPSGTGSITGRLTAIDTDTSPRQVIVRADGVDNSIPFTRHTDIFLAVPGQPRQQASLADLQMGDMVTVRRDDRGFADAISIRFAEVRGRVSSVGQTADGNNEITLNNGTTVELTPNANFRFNGREIGIGGVRPGDRVVIRTNPLNNLGYAVSVNPVYAHRSGL